MKTLLMGLVMCVAMFGQNILTVQPAQAAVRVGDTWTGTIRFQATAAVAAMEFTVNLPAGMAGAVLSTPLDRLEAGTAKQITCDSTGKRCVISGFSNVAHIPTGVVATVTALVESVPPGANEITLAAVELASPTGAAVPYTAGALFTLSVFPGFDLTGDGATDEADYSALLLQVVGTCTPSGDLNQDGKCSARDLVLMTRAILGL